MERKIETPNDLQEVLEEIKEGFDERMDRKIKEQLDPVKSDLDQTVKAFDKYQINVKRTGAASLTQIMDLKSSVTRSLEENHDKLAKFISGEKSTPLSIEIKDMSLTSSLTGGTTAINMTPTQIVGAISRSSHIRDVLNKIPMSTGTLPVIVDNGNTGNFAAVAEAALKPTVDFALKESPMKAEVIAAISIVTRQFLDDLGPRGVQSWLTNRLTELYLRAEDNALLSGTGVSPQITGLNDPGNFTAATGTGTDVERLVRALTQMMVQDRIPKAIIINPGSLDDILLNQSSGAGTFDLPNYFQVNERGGISILGIPCIITTAQTAHQFNVLDTDGIIMGIREALNIRMFEQDSTNARYNLITVRAEARIALANYSPLNVIMGSFVSEES